MNLQEIPKRRLTHRAGRAIGAAGACVLALGWLATGGLAQAPTPPGAAVDPATHAAHVAAGMMAMPAANRDATLSQQLTQLQAKFAQLEGAVARTAVRPPVSAVPAVGALPGMSGTAPAAPMASVAPGAATTGGAAAPPGGMTGMMGKMDKMMGMMEKMMPMAGGAMPAAAPMPGAGMGKAMMAKMMPKGAGAMPAGAAPMPGRGMGMKQSKMAEMSSAAPLPSSAVTPAGMGLAPTGTAAMMGVNALSSGETGLLPQSALPGFPGASHLYHIGATGFFLDHPQHVVLTTEQQSALNRVRELALLSKSTADRAVQQSEQDLWALTASDQPDAAAIKTKIDEIGKLTGDERLAFIRAVGEASTLLTDEQRRALAGYPAATVALAPAAAPAPTPAAASAAPPMAAGMSDM